MTAGALVFAFGLASTALATKPDVHKVTICHRTGSDNNPYIVEKIDITSTTYADAGGHGDHTGPVWPATAGDPPKWGDIIPPYDYDPAQFHFPGYNWGSDGQAIWNNACNVPTIVGESGVSTEIHLGDGVAEGEPDVVGEGNMPTVQDTLHDSAIVTWNGDATDPGKVQFFLYKGLDCNVDQPVGSSASLDVKGPSPVSVDPGLVESKLDAGDYSFRAVFTSDTESVSGSTSACEPFSVMAFSQTEEPATDIPSEPNTATLPTGGTSGPSDSSWLLVAALGVVLASVVVMTPARAKNRR